ncbi:MAG TPA: transporter associated domain-containing protein, partial [Acidimicrobiales bacterium]
LEDIIEELVGEIVDEFDVDDPIVEPLPGGGIRVHGRTPLDQVNDILGARLPEGDWDTIGGLVYDRVGHVPVEGETIRVAGWHLTAQRIQGRRIGRVSITPEPRAVDRPAGAAGIGAGVTDPPPAGDPVGEPAPADAPADATEAAGGGRRAATNGLGGDAPEPAAGSRSTSRPGGRAAPPPSEG